MANKKKSTRSKKNQMKRTDETVAIYIYALIIIAFCIIACLRLGVFGKFLAGIMLALVGKLYICVFMLLIVTVVLWMMKKSISDIPLQYIVGVFSLILVWLLFISLDKSGSMESQEYMINYFHQFTQIVQGIDAGGGFIGAFLLSLCIFLFDYLGTKILISIILVLGILSILSGPVLAYLTKGAVVLKKPMEYMHGTLRDVKTKRSNKKPKGKSKNNVPNDTSIYGNIDLEERVRQGQVSFLDVDDDFDLVSDVRNNVVEKREPKKVQSEKEKEDQRIIEDTIGQKDTFVSAFQEDWSNYQLPYLSLLNDVGKKTRSIANVKAANDAGQRLIELLDEFGVRATLLATHIGPTVTKFEIKPDLGVRVNKISNLQYDIKMALATKDIRIEAPIPGKSAVGIEIANVEKTSVSMKELMKGIPDTYREKKLLFALGKDLMGNCIYGELNKMPHLLIAGTTGSGKSVCVNSIITSILMRACPDEVKLLLIDPKKVEFTPYKDIPHLLGPVITDSDEANRALKVIVTIMEKRYELFSQAEVRNIAGYNAYVANHPDLNLDKLPWIVVIIDELADLMLVAAKEVEGSIQRITQLARAAGIHLIVATQRPSVDVVTGVIKANIPSRIAFAVSSAVDSRTILDEMGAEKLLGNGDMLYIPVGETNPIRVQGVFVSDQEVAAITDFVGKQGKPKYEDAFLRLAAVDAAYGDSNDCSDPLLMEVKHFIIQTRKASTSLIQRKFSIGYARAARLIDVLEEQGVIGPSRGSKPREVLVKYEDDGEDFDV